MLVEGPSPGDPIRESEQALDPDIAHELAIMRIIDQDILAENVLRYAHEHPDSTTEFVEPMIDLIFTTYGTTPRKLSPLPAVLHPLRLAQPSPSEGQVHSTVTLIRLGHDLVEDFGVRPQDLMPYGGEDVVTGITILTHATDESYAEYLKKIKRYDRRFPHLQVKNAKGRDMSNNSLDPMGLDPEIPRHEKTAQKMANVLDKYAKNMHHLFDPHDLWVPRLQAIHALGREALVHPQLVVSPKAA